MRKKEILALGLTLLVVSIIVSAGKGMPMPTNDDLIRIQPIPAARVDHDPIIIDGNDDLLIQKADNGWIGTGEAGSPITIADYRIEFYDEGITIRNVDLHFAILNCETADIDSQYYASTGIKLDNCSNGDISNSLAHMKETGIFIKNSEHIRVSGSTVHDCSAGISVEDCYDVTIISNNFGWNDFVGVNITGTSRCVVYDNSILSIPYFGVMCIVDTNTYLSGNIITSGYLEDPEFDHVGFLSYYSVNFAMYNTTISECAIGLEMQNTDGAWIWECSFANTTEYGVYLDEDTYNVTIIENYLGPTVGENAYDDGVENSWDSSYSEIGNWWSDYSGTGYYYINGTAQSIDHYPNGFVPTTTTTVTSTTSTITTTTTPETSPTTNTTSETSTDGLTGGTTTNGTTFQIPSEVTLLVSIGSASIIVIVVIVIIRGKQ